MLVLCPSALQPRFSSRCGFGCVACSGFNLALAVRGFVCRCCWLSSRIVVDSCLGQIGGMRGLRLTMNHIDDAVVLRLARAHPVVAVDIARNTVYLLARIGSHELLQSRVEPEYFPGVHFDVRRR